MAVTLRIYCHLLLKLINDRTNFKQAVVTSVADSGVESQSILTFPSSQIDIMDQDPPIQNVPTTSNQGRSTSPPSSNDETDSDEAGIR